MNVDPNFDMEMAIYKEQKEIAKKFKEDCVAKNYQNYLNAKPEKESQKP